MMLVPDPAVTPFAAASTGKGTVVDRIFGDSFESPPPAGPGAALVVLNKLAYGPRPGDVAAFTALGGSDPARLAAFVEQQLAPAAINDADCDARISAAGYTTTSKSLAQLWSDHVRDRGNTGLDDYPFRYYPVAETQGVRILRATYSRRQVFERMVEFWHDHFNVLGWEFSIAPVFVHYDRDVIRPRALGNFRELLEEVAKAPAMLQFLDNKSSSVAGFNENFARELCELHTLGAQNYYPGNNPFEVPRDSFGVPLGYCDNDVYEAARALTGWTMRDAHWQFPATPDYDSGEFLYWDNWHDKASKLFVGEFIPPNNPGGAMADGRRVLDILCQHTGTAKHLCGKLIRRFICDEPPLTLVDSAAAIWVANWQAPDQIARVLRHILNSPEVLARWGEKTKRPYEVLVHALRGAGAELSPRPFATWNPYGQFDSLLQQSGHGPFRWPTPDGYPDVSRTWQTVSPLAQTWRLLTRLPELRAPGSGDVPFLLRIHQTTLQAFPQASSRTANAIVDYWLDRIVGVPVEPARRATLVDVLRQNAAADAALDLVEDNTNGTTGLPEHTGRWNDGNLSRHYSIARLRSAVALMFTLPEFYRR